MSMEPLDMVRLYMAIEQNRRAIQEYLYRIDKRFGVRVLLARHPKHLGRDGIHAWSQWCPTDRSRPFPYTEVREEWKALVTQALRLRRAAEELPGGALDWLVFPGNLMPDHAS